MVQCDGLEALHLSVSGMLSILAAQVSFGRLASLVEFKRAECFMSL